MVAPIKRTLFGQIAHSGLPPVQSNLKNGEFVVIDRDGSQLPETKFPPVEANAYSLSLPPRKRLESPAKTKIDAGRTEIARRMTITRRMTVHGIEQRKLMENAAKLVGVEAEVTFEDEQ